MTEVMAFQFPSLVFKPHCGVCAQIGGFLVLDCGIGFWMHGYCVLIGDMKVFLKLHSGVVGLFSFEIIIVSFTIFYFS